MVGELELRQARHIAGAMKLCSDLENSRAGGLCLRQTLFECGIFRQFFEIMKGCDPRQFSLTQLIDQPRHRADACDLNVDAGGLVQHFAQHGLPRGGIQVARAAFRRAYARIAALNAILSDYLPHSELNQLALTLNHTFAQLEAAFARQTRFITDAAHELRTPVAVLLTQTQSILARERSPDEYREALQACLRAAQRMRTLSEALLELSQSNLPANDLKTIDLAAAASECVDFILPLAHAKSLQITRDIPATPCLAHPPSLARALNCLLENAVEYTPENGWIRLTTRTTPAWSVLQIANSGPGIPPQELPLMFEPFHRTDKSRTLGQKIHCGLGLPITKNLLMAQKAEIQVESSPGSETVFTLRFRPAGTLADSGSAALL